MTWLVRLCFAALLGLGLVSAGGAARAASAPVPLAETEALPDSLGYYGHRGWRGYRAYRHRYHHRPVYARAHYGPRRHYYSRPVYSRAYYGPRRHHYRPYRPRPVYIHRPRPVYHYSCVRQGWVWNGWQHVWRRYRVC